MQSNLCFGFLQNLKREPLIAADIKGETRRRRKLAPNVENVQIFPSVDFIIIVVVLPVFVCVFLYRKGTFLHASNWSPQCGATLVCSLLPKSNKQTTQNGNSLVTHFKNVPYIAVLSTTSLTQATGHEKAAVMVVLLPLSSVVSLRNRPRNRVKTDACLFRCCCFNFVPIDKGHEASSVRSPFNFSILGTPSLETNKQMITAVAHKGQPVKTVDRKCGARGSNPLTLGAVFLWLGGIIRPMIRPVPPINLLGVRQQQLGTAASSVDQHQDVTLTNIKTLQWPTSRGYIDQHQDVTLTNIRTLHWPTSRFAITNIKTLSW